MRFTTTHELQATIDAINKQYDFDLDWQYVGKNHPPEIMVFEQEEGHELTRGPLELLYGRMARDLPSWSMKMVDIRRRHD